MQMTFNQMTHSGDYKEDDISVSVTVLGGTYGGGSETLVVWKTVEDTAEPLDASYYKGQGSRGGESGR